MKYRLLGIICIAIFFLTLSANHAFTELSQTTIEKILSARESYDGKEVSVSGKVWHLKLKTSKRGNDYTTFTLSGGGSLNVYSRGHAQVKQGQTVKVTGKYRKEKRIGKYTFRNEIDASDIKQE